MKKILILLVTLFLTNTFASAAIKVSPSYIELDANTTKKDYISGSFTVTGGKDETIRFKVYPVFKYDTLGRFLEIQDNAQKNSLMGKIKFYPSEFTCQNGESQRVRFTITDLKTLPNGDSRLMLFLEDTKTKEVALKGANGKIAGTLEIKTRVGVPIFVDKGFYTKKASLDYLKIKKTGDDYNCAYKVISNGNSKIRYNGVGYLSQSGNLIKQFPVYGAVVFGGSFLEKLQYIDIPKNSLDEDKEYKIKFVITYQDEHNNDKILKKEITFKPIKEEKKI